jgi:DNA repair protein RadC
LKSIKDLADFDKPREKLMAKGVEALKSEELMAILLGSGVAGKDVRKLAKEIIALLDREFNELSLEKLTQIHGLGVAKASVILASLELSRRYLIKSNSVIKSAKDLYSELKEYANKKQEYFLCITLDGASHIINKRVVFIGTLNQSIVHPREVFADAIADRAAGVIVAHNHPSGNLSPSSADIAITDRLQEVAKLIGIELLDHIIISKDGYFSFSDEGLI